MVSCTPRLAAGGLAALPNLGIGHQDGRFSPGIGFANPGAGVNTHDEGDRRGRRDLAIEERPVATVYMPGSRLGGLLVRVNPLDVEGQLSPLFSATSGDTGLDERGVLRSHGLPGYLWFAWWAGGNRSRELPVTTHQTGNQQKEGQ